MESPCRLHQLPAREGKLLRVIVEVPKNSRSKYKYDPATGTFSVHRSLPAGMHFPYDYGFVPSTRGEDGDPLDVLVFVDTDTFPGCIVNARLLGVITGTQKAEKGGRVNNDILLAAHVEAVSWKDVTSIDRISPALLDEIEFFFTSYRNFQGKEFKVGARRGIAAAVRLLRGGIARGRTPLST